MEAGVPRIREVETLAPKEGADYYEYRPEHEVDRLYGDCELTIFRCLGWIAIDVGGERQHHQHNPWNGDPSDHGVEHC